jgi:butyryl-CoA dehydrogenase
MFHMMNEARIGVGIAATMLGLAGYYASLEYAKNRPQGRPMGAGGKDPSQPQVRIIEHSDVKRMLLAQKSYGEGALALALYCARLVDEQHTAEAAEADDARLLLEVLTPIAKSWPSEWCLEANSLAIQVHGGYGYTRDFPVEQYWRDNRLNMIHEGAHGIQAMDLLGRKVLMENGRGMQLLAGRMQATMARAATDATLAPYAQALGKALAHVETATQAAWAHGAPTEALANAVPYMQAFGHTVLAWIWLDVACTALAGDAAQAQSATVGRLGATRFFFHYELPKVGAWLSVVQSRDMTCATFPEEAF